MKSIKLAILATLAACSTTALAGFHCTQKPCPPDSWNAWDMHVSYSAGIGAVAELAVPPLARSLGINSALGQQALTLGVCLVPGFVREWRSRNDPGNAFSNRDMIANTAGCAIGMGAAAGLRWAVTPAGAMRVSYSKEW